MTLYPGTKLEQEYAHGLDEGRAQAEEDLASGYVHHETSDTTAVESESRSQRAWALGYLRGYREIVRTLRDGRWGT